MNQKYFGICHRNRHLRLYESPLLIYGGLWIRSTDVVSCPSTEVSFKNSLHGNSTHCRHTFGDKVYISIFSPDPPIYEWTRGELTEWVGQNKRKPSKHRNERKLRMWVTRWGAATFKWIILGASAASLLICILKIQHLAADAAKDTNTQPQTNKLVEKQILYCTFAHLPCTFLLFHLCW